MITNYITINIRRIIRMEQTTQTQEQDEQVVYKNIYCLVCNKITRQVKHDRYNRYVCSHRIGVGK